LANCCEKWFSDVFVFAAIAVFIVSIGAVNISRTPSQISIDFLAPVTIFLLRFLSKTMPFLAPILP
jgi:short subunit fatty acids transporter